MDAKTQAIIENLVNDRVKRDELFTAYDITKDIRNEGLHEYHKNIKQVVHDMFTNGQLTPSYTRSLIKLSPSDQAYVYHPSHANVNDYDPNVIHNVASPAIPGIVTVSAINSNGSGGAVIAPGGRVYGQSQISSATLGGVASNTNPQLAQTVTAPSHSRLGRSKYVTIDGKRLLDKSFRLRVPTKVLRSAGFNPGDLVYVTIDALQKQIKGSQIPSGSALRYKVDTKGNIRIGTLCHKGLSGVRVFTFSSGATQFTCNGQ